jgi:hypothetical protein
VEARASGKHSAQFVLKPCRSLSEVLTDRGLASLGDSFVNFAYSLALSGRMRKPLGVKVKGAILAQALRNAGLREYLPSRMTTHALADAAEAMLVYAWLQDLCTLEETIKIIAENEDPVKGLTQLLVTLKKRITFS